MTERERVFTHSVMLDPEALYVADSLTPTHEERAAWLKHVRIYERGVAFREPSVIEVMADLFKTAEDQTSVDEAIRREGIMGCWRPSTVFVQRLTAYMTGTVLVDSATVAHAIWNIDWHRGMRRGDRYGIELFNDEPRARSVQIVFTSVEMTDEEIGLGGADESEVRQMLRRYQSETDDRITRLERELATANKTIHALAAKARG
jgi:hypothetical protein